MRRIKRGFRCLAALAVLWTGGATVAWAEPPIRSPEDAACRNEARARVFSAPNPRGLDLEEIGRGIYFACMKRMSPRKHGRNRR